MSPIARTTGFPSVAGINESQARTNLRQLLHHLRRALPAECCLLIAGNHTVQWRARPACTIDVVEFDAALSRDGTAPPAPAANARHWKKPPASIRTICSPACTTIGCSRSANITAANWRTRCAGWRCCRRTARLSRRHPPRRTPGGARPLSEAHHQLLIRLHAANHDRASALRAYHQCIQVLRRELGVDP